LYKLLFKDAFDAAEIQPYKESDFCPVEEVARGVAADEPDEQELEKLAELMPLMRLIAAQEHAENILADARRESKAIKQTAHEDGRRLGEQEGKQEVVPALTSFAHTVQSLIVFEERMISRFTPEIVRLALEIAEKVIGRAVAVDAEITASVLERAKKEVADARHMRILLNPADHCVLAELRPDLVRSEERGGRKIEVAPSEDVARGGCRIETEIGVVDATVPTQLEEIERQLLEE
jgi:flagellar biosynthesis/type III secretory pathway protein FliH